MRTLTEIRSDLLTKQQEQLPNLSSSQAADWFIWINIFAYGIYLFEAVMDVFKADVESQLEKNQPGTPKWYSEKALAFQNGYALQVDDFGVVGYAVIDEAARLVQHASVVENTDGTVTIKVAKINEESNELEPLSLTNGEYLNFQRYMNKVKFAGTAVEYRTLDPDSVKYDINIYYDPLYVPANVQAAVLEALDVFRIDLSFDARLYKSDFVNAIQAVPGVKSVKVNSMNILPSDGDAIVLDVVQELASGYFNYSETSTITMLNVNA